MIIFYEQKSLLLLAFFLLYFERMSLLSFLHSELFYCQQQQKLNEQQLQITETVYDMFCSKAMSLYKKMMPRYL